MNIVLFEPEIPQNTGNIGRTCVVTNSTLHLIKPLGFSLDEKSVKRSGLDYWDQLDLKVYENYEDFLNKNQNITLWFGTTKAPNVYSDVSYSENDFIMFGKESKGIPEEILANHKNNCIRIPMFGDTRSLNLSNSVCIVLYEALRQQNFNGLTEQGNLHNLKWE